ncbi:MAG: zinc-ribbon domain-containing protein [Acidocella sp.]|nr:zinc-ribbon domain-containing protein [Acidocella sp.]
MRISCPGCQTEYDVPDAAFAGRARTLRCQQCNHQWQAAPPVEPPATPQVTVPPAAWPAAESPAGLTANRSVYDDMPRVIDRPSAAPPPTEPAPRAPAWPSPTNDDPAHDPFTYAGPSSTAEILASLSRNANAEPDPNPYADTGNEADSTRDATALPGNEERFAALVKSSRAPDEYERRGRSGIFTTFIILVFIFGGIYAGRAQVMHTIPASAPFFAGIDHLFGVQPK